MKFLKENGRALIYMAIAIVLEIVGLWAAYLLLTSAEPQEMLASLVLVATPGVVLTIFVPALRDLSRGVRTAAFVFLTLGVACGLIVISQMFYSGASLDATIAVGLFCIIITVGVSYLDWSPQKKRNANVANG